MFFESKLQRNLFIFFNAILVFFGLLSASTLLTPLPPPENFIKQQEKQLRQPASLKLLDSGLAVDSQTKVASLNLDCLYEKEEPLRLESQAKQIRFLGKACFGKGLEQVQLTNRSNGYQATMFSLGKNQFSSDYMHLVNGENNLLLTIAANDGNTLVKQITIIR